MASQFKVVGIYGRVKSPGVAETLKMLISTLRTWQQPFIVETETAQGLEEADLTLVERPHLAEHCQLLIVVGGDGSLLHAAHAIIEHDIPVIGINRGRLGFLTDILPSELEQLQHILAGQYRLEQRFLLTATVTYHGKILGQSSALNEVALIPDSVPHMNEFEVYVDDQFMCSQDSDGLIVATPTGSTAYALSGGGPIVHPQLDAIVMVPMFPHTLTMRPIVIHGESKITIAITPNNPSAPRLTCDGQNFISTPPGSQILIEKKSKRLHLIHPLDYDYYKSLRSKLHWGRKLHYVE